MSSPTNALVGSYLTPTRQLGAVSSNQQQVITPESTTPTQDAQAKQQILDTVFPPSQRRNTPGYNASALQVLIDAMNNGFIRQYYSQDEVAADCAQANKTGVTSLQLATKSAGVLAGATSLAVGTAAHASALATIGIGINVAPVVGQIISGAIAAFTVIAGIFAHHAQAVEQEQTILCYVVPQINQAIMGLDSAIANNQISLQQAFTGLDTLHQSYLTNVRPILQESNTSCNAACVIDRGIVALILWKKYQYSQFVSSNPVVQVGQTIQDTVTQVSNTVSNATGLPVNYSKGLLFVIAAVIIFFLLKGL